MEEISNPPPISLEAIRACLKEKNSPDSGTEMIEIIDSQDHDLKKIKEDLDDPINSAIIKPNLESIRKILGGDGTDQQRKVVEENTGLIPKYYKVRQVIIIIIPKVRRYHIDNFVSRLRF